VRLEQPDTVAALLKAGANQNQVFSTFGHPERFKVAADEGNGPMVNAVRNGDVDTLKKLLASGGDPYSKTETGRRVIDFAKELGNKKVLAVLGSSKSKEPPMDMETAIVKNNVPRVLELIKKEGTDYALIKAADDGCLEVLRSILASKTKKDPTKVAEALWHASFNGEAKSAALLLEHGADPNFVDRLFGKTTLGATKYKNKLPIVAMLEKAGARLRPTKK